MSEIKKNIIQFLFLWILTIIAPSLYPLSLDDLTTPDSSIVLPLEANETSFDSNNTEHFALLSYVKYSGFINAEFAILFVAAIPTGDYQIYFNDTQQGTLTISDISQNGVNFTPATTGLLFFSSLNLDILNLPINNLSFSIPGSTIEIRQNETIYFSSVIPETTNNNQINLGEFTAITKETLIQNNQNIYKSTTFPAKIKFKTWTKNNQNKIKIILNHFQNNSKYQLIIDGKVIHSIKTDSLGSAKLIKVLNFNPKGLLLKILPDESWYQLIDESNNYLVDNHSITMSIPKKVRHKINYTYTKLLFSPTGFANKQSKAILRIKNINDTPQWLINLKDFKHQKFEIYTDQQLLESVNIKTSNEKIKINQQTHPNINLESLFGSTISIKDENSTTYFTAIIPSKIKV